MAEEEVSSYSRSGCDLPEYYYGPFATTIDSLSCKERRMERSPVMAEDLEVKREITLEADAETLERMRKEGHARGFTVYCDEGERIGGDNSAPPPLAYFGLSLAF